MAVLPETMDPLGTDAERNFSVLENYIRYMGERLEFAMAGLGRTVSAAGMSSAGVALSLDELRRDLAALESRVGEVSGGVNELKAGLGELTAVKTQLNTLSVALDVVKAGLAALEARVDALEVSGA